ncbi:MAG: transposase [Anaeromyxobacteraceae bacterium]
MTLRVREHVWNLRSLRSWRVIAAALEGVRSREDFRVIHLSVQGNHLHVIVEAADAGALAQGMRALAGRLAKGLNALMERRGQVFADRYHAHLLRTPAEVRNALRYVLDNFASHASRRGEPVQEADADRFSTAAALAPDGRPFAVSSPRTWLLTRCEPWAAAGRRGRSSFRPHPRSDTSLHAPAADADP